METCDEFGGDSPEDSNHRHSRHNFRMGVIAGMFAATARDFVHPQLILAGLIYSLTRSPFLVALVTIINKGGVLAPQLLISNFLEHSPRRRPQFVVLTVVRTSMYVLLFAAMWYLCRGVTFVSLLVFFVIYALTCLSSASAHIVYCDMVGRLIPVQRTGAYIGIRSCLGGIVSMVAGFAVIQPILSEVRMPVNYLWLAGLGALLVLIDMSIFCQCREDPGPSAENRTTFSESFRRGMQWLRTDHDYRCYLVQRIGFRVSFLGLAFFIPYGMETLSDGRTGGGVAMLGGIMVGVMKLSRTTGGLLWGHVADHHGSRRVLLAGAACLGLAPVCVLLAPELPAAFSWLVAGIGPFDLPLLVYLGALAVLGFGIQATMVGGQRFLIISAPAHRRASYIGFVNTVTSPLTLLPLAAAWLAKSAGMHTVFVCTVVGGIISLVGAAMMSRQRQ